MRGDRSCSPAVRRTGSRPHMRFDLSCQTMMSTQVGPGTPGYGADKPFNSRCHRTAGGSIGRSSPAETDLLSAIAAFRTTGFADHPAKRLAAGWWSQTGSNRRPHACKARALPAELWPRNQKTNARSIKVVGLGRLELPTSRLSSARSNQLSYKPLTLIL